MRRETENTVLFLVGLSIGLITLTGAFTRYVKSALLPWLAITAVLLMGLALVAIVGDIRRGGDGHDGRSLRAHPRQHRGVNGALVGRRDALQQLELRQLLGQPAAADRAVGQEDDAALLQRRNRVAAWPEHAFRILALRESSRKATRVNQRIGLELGAGKRRKFVLVPRRLVE